MLHLMRGEEFIYSLAPGSTAQLPDGSFVSPAKDGWSNEEYHIVRVQEPEIEPLTPTQQLEIERSKMTLSFSQFVVGLVEQGWITEAEANNWLSANSLPTAVEAALSTLPVVTPDGSKPQLRARARALRPTSIERMNELLLMMAAMRQTTAEQLDAFFSTYAEI